MPTRRASRRYLGGQKASRKAMMPTTAEACSVRASKRILLRSSSEQPSGITFIAYRSDVRLCRTSCGGEVGEEEAGDSEGAVLSAVRRKAAMGVGRLALTTPDEPLPSSRTTSSAESVKAPSLPPLLPVDAPPAGAPLDPASAPDGTPNIQ